LIGYLEHTIPADHPFSRIQLSPDGETLPEIWILGSSDQSAVFAAYFGRAYSFAQFITDEGGPEIVESYRRQFRASDKLAKPEASIGVFVLCAPTEDEAKYLAASRDLSRLRQRQGIPLPFPPPEEALNYPFNEAERRLVEYHRRRQVVGDPAQVKEKLEAMAAEYGVEEIVVLTIAHDFSARKRSYSLLAEAFGLG
jgi:luciferase family oxidoreductase group 1